MSKRKAIIISIVLLVIAIITMFMAYFMFHYLNADGSFGEWKPKPAKPVVTYVVVEFSLLSYFAALIFFLIGIIKPKK